jgi:hypothetical protein
MFPRESDQGCFLCQDWKTGTWFWVRTVAAILVRVLPSRWSAGIGADVIKRIAAPMEAE